MKYECKCDQDSIRRERIRDRRKRSRYVEYVFVSDRQLRLLDRQSELPDWAIGRVLVRASEG